MIDTIPTPQVEQRVSPRTPEEKDQRAGTSVGILALCFVLAIVSIFLGTRIHNQNVVLADVKAQLAQASSKAAQAQADLDAAKVQSTALQAQLQSDQTQRSDLQSQLVQANARSVSLQAQVSRDQGQRSDLQSQINSSKAQFAAMQAQLNTANQESSALSAQLDQAKSHAGDMQAQLAKAQVDLTRVHPLLVQARQLPLTIAFERSFWDLGFTLHVSNPGSAALNLRIKISGTDRTRSQMAVIEAGATLDVPHLPAGENVLIASDGYDPLNLTAR